MVLTCISIAMCVFILHIHRLGTVGQEVPSWLRRLVTRYLARAVGMASLIRIHESAHVEVDDGGATCQEETKPLRVDCEDFSSRYKLIQVEGSGLCILAKDTEPSAHLEKGDKEEISDLHRVRDKRVVLKPLKAVLVKPSQKEGDEHKVVNTEVIWHDIAEVLDRFFFWLSFVIITLCTVCILVIVPLSKPEHPGLNPRGGQ